MDPFRSTDKNSIDDCIDTIPSKEDRTDVRYQVQSLRTQLDMAYNEIEWLRRMIEAALGGK